MVVLALLLLILVVLLVVFMVITGSRGEVPLEWDQLNIAFSPSPLVLFLMGAVTLLLAVLALGLLRGGTRRGATKRKELKRLRQIETDRQADEQRAHQQNPNQQHVVAERSSSADGRGLDETRTQQQGARLDKGHQNGPQREQGVRADRDVDVTDGRSDDTWHREPGSR